MRRGNTLIPILVMAAAVVAFSVLAFVAVTDARKASNSNTATTASASNTNIAAANTNASANANIAVDEMKDWKTYTNVKEKYSIEYPPNWEVTVGTASIGLTPKSSAGTNTNVAAGDCCPGPGINLVATKAVVDEPPFTRNRSTYKINGITVIRQEHGGFGNELETYFQRQAGDYVLASWEKDLGTELHDQILSTFTFTK